MKKPQQQSGTGGAAGTPAFRSARAFHRADTCRPLVAAAQRGEVRLEALVRGAYPGRRMPRGLLPQVRSIGFWDASREQQWGLPEHCNEGIELTYLESGRLAFFVEGRAHPLRPGDLTVTRPWQPHQVGDPAVGAGRLHWIILDVGVRRPHQPWTWPSWMILSRRDLDDLTGMLRQNEQPVWPGTPELGRCFAEIGRLVGRSDADVLDSRLVLRVNELFVCVLEMLRRRKVGRDSELTSTERSVALFLEELRRDVAEPWTLDSMAAHAGLKRSRFSHYCRRLTNCTPLHYLNLLRVRRAQDIIRADPARSLTDVALDCGFSTSQYFATVFRRVTGVRPSDCRRPDARISSAGC